MGQRTYLDAEQVIDRYREMWHEALDEENAKQGVVWGELEERATFELGRAAIAIAFERLVPKLGYPVAVQRKLEFKFADDLDWSIVCYLDLETSTADLEQEVHRVVDYKVKGAQVSNWQADRDPQAGLYLAARWLTGWPAQELCFAQILKPGRQRKQLGVALTRTTRGVGQMRSSLARIAQAASQINALYDRFGPDRPWGFADPTGWKCSARYCDAWGRCPGGGGL